MSRKYQGLIILNPKAESSVEDTVSAISKDFEAEGAKVEKVAQLGRRQFAYESNHLDAGNYVNITFNGPAESIKKIQARLKLNDTVHLQHYQRLA